MKHYFETVQSVLKEVNSTENGLTNEAANALGTGKNKLAQGKKISLAMRFINQLSDPMIIILLAAALVSMLTLESTMLTTFGDGTMTVVAQKWMLGATGGAISVLIVATAIYMIVVGTKKLKQLKSEVENGKQ